MKEPQIMIALAVRDRGWILPEFLKCLQNLDYPHEAITLYFLVNNSTDNTEKILDEFLEKNNKQYKKLRLCVVENDLIPEDDRTASTRLRYIYSHLVELKNEIKKYALREKVDYLLLLESDVLFPPNLLTSLLSHRKDIISPLIPVTIKKDRYNIMKKGKGKIWMKSPPYGHILHPALNTLLKVDMSGGIFLIKKKALRKVKWQYHPQGEDCGFATACERKGLEIYCDSDIRCEHRMIKTVQLLHG